MLAGLDACGRVFGVEVGGRLDDNGVDFGLQQAFVSRQASVNPRCVDLALLRKTGGLVREVVSTGDELVAAMFAEKVGNPMSAPAATDHAERDPGIGLGAADGLWRQHGGRHRGCARIEQMSAAQCILRMIEVGHAWFSLMARSCSWQATPPTLRITEWSVDTLGATSTGALRTQPEKKPRTRWIRGSINPARCRDYFATGIPYTSTSV